MAKSRLQIAKKDILKFFEAEAPHIMRYKDIASILASHRDFWRLAQRTNTDEFTHFLSKSGKLQKIVLSFPKRKETRFTWGNQNLTDVLLTLGKESYFSHYTAMQMHGMTEQIPKILYINHEQKAQKTKEIYIDQNGIDKAFQKKPRISSNIVTYDNIKICMLNGQFTDQLGIITDHVSFANKKIKVRITNIERTLIDITVRPAYAGGIFEVLKAYKNVIDIVSVNSISSMLKKINYIYPYHQALGFYMERAGYPSRDLKIIKKFTMEYNFYLTNQIEKSEYIKEWKLYVPAGF